MEFVTNKCLLFRVKATHSSYVYSFHSKTTTFSLIHFFRNKVKISKSKTRTNDMKHASVSFAIPMLF